MFMDPMFLTLEHGIYATPARPCSPPLAWATLSLAHSSSAIWTCMGPDLVLLQTAAQTKQKLLTRTPLTACALPISRGIPRAWVFSLSSCMHHITYVSFNALCFEGFMADQHPLGVSSHCCLSWY